MVTLECLALHVYYEIASELTCQIRRPLQTLNIVSVTSVNTCSTFNAHISSVEQGVSFHFDQSRVLYWSVRHSTH